MALHFSSERPEDQFYTDFGNLNKFGEDVSVINQMQLFYSLFPRPLQSWTRLFLTFWMIPNRSKVRCEKRVYIIMSSYRLQAGQFLTHLEEFGAQKSLGLAALKNLVKTILVISSLPV